MTMDLIELAKQCPQMSVTVQLRDLLDAGEALARRIQEETEAAVANRAAEIGGRLVPAEEASQEAVAAAAEVVEAEEADQPPEDKKKRFRALFLPFEQVLS